MRSPKLACCNFIPKTDELREFALDYGFDGVDWTFTPENLPSSDTEEKELAERLRSLRPLEIRYHLFFVENEIGRKNAGLADSDKRLFFKACRIISRLRGKHVTVHIGLDRRQAAAEISWLKTVSGLKDLTDFGRTVGIRVCLENLAWGWTSRPDLFEKIIRKSSCWGTLDIGHARASQSVISGAYDFEDFAYPNLQRILNAHIYDRETNSGHLPPSRVPDIESRLQTLARLPLCDWWVLELREIGSLMKTLRVIREFLLMRANSEPEKLISA